jgi:hypothetical protein
MAWSWILCIIIRRVRERPRPVVLQNGKTLSLRDVEECAKCVVRLNGTAKDHRAKFVTNSYYIRNRFPVEPGLRSYDASILFLHVATPMVSDIAL